MGNKLSTGKQKKNRIINKWDWAGISVLNGWNFLFCFIFFLQQRNKSWNWKQNQKSEHKYEITCEQ